MPYFTHRQVDLHYQVDGAGDTVLLLHGLGSRGSDWEFQLPALGEHYRVVTIDLRGHGDSDPGAERLTIPAMAGDVVALLDHLGLASAHVVGFSLGGMVAQQLALDAPGRLRSLCLINTGPHALSGRLQRYGQLTLRKFVIRALGMERLAAYLSRRLFPLPEQAHLTARFRRHMAAMPARNYLNCLDALRRWDISSRLREIHTPCLIIASDEDYTPVAAKRAVAAQIPGATLAIVKDSRHAAPMDQPAAINQLLLDFLNRREADTAHRQTPVPTTEPTITPPMGGEAHATTR
ncbi:alpha/beta fold hydrolase [Parahaliea mediterranea]|uniref:Alpha/beta fold hydrolase n=1 Tax=Parahaliea mediterranea TaxID=651086 RepID=A0A939DFE1_9GAMM|nr:alpha/beta fold hydrolase [Parahaliea mediterranea]MBN7796497.1 alpha/beta fold hydrolase [Parahaliea mediterranea]